MKGSFKITISKPHAIYDYIISNNISILPLVFVETLKNNEIKDITINIDEHKEIILTNSFIKKAISDIDVLEKLINILEKIYVPLNSTPFDHAKIFFDKSTNHFASKVAYYNKNHSMFLVTFFNNSIKDLLENFTLKVNLDIEIIYEFFNEKAQTLFENVKDIKKSISNDIMYIFTQNEEYRIFIKDIKQYAMFSRKLKNTLKLYRLHEILYDKVIYLNGFFFDKQFLLNDFIETPEYQTTFNIMCKKISKLVPPEYHTTPPYLLFDCSVQLFRLDTVVGSIVNPITKDDFEKIIRYCNMERFSNLINTE